MTSLRSPQEAKATEVHLHIVPVPDRSIPLQSPACFSMDLSRRATLISEALQQLRSQSMQLARAADYLTAALLEGGRVLVAGQGGSVANAQHLASELIARYPGERAYHVALALIADSYVTKVESETDAPDVFSRQIAAYRYRGDVFVAFGTSGANRDLVHAARTASAMGMTVIAITGPCPNLLESAADVSITVSNGDAQVVREAHVVVLHLLSEAVERALVEAMKGSRAG
jgi:phosphoheptose isomerase